MDNYFAIERDGKWINHVCITRDDGTIAFQDVMSMSYDEIKEYTDIHELIAAVMNATNEYFNCDDEQTLITLVGSDDVFIWGILIGPSDNDDELRYVFIDWQKDGKKYRYEK